MRLKANTPPSPPAGYHSCAIKTDKTVVCWGWTAATGRPMRLKANTPPSPPDNVSFVRDQNRQNRSLLGPQRLRAGRCASRPIHRHHRQQCAFVRDQNRQNRSLLGRCLGVGKIVRQLSGWRLLAIVGDCWRLLAIVGDCWRLLAIVGGLWECVGWICVVVLCCWMRFFRSGPKECSYL